MVPCRLRVPSASQLRARPLLHGVRRFSTAHNICAPGRTKVGWIGSGVMGKSMVSHIMNAGYETSVYSRTLSKCEPLRDLGAAVRDTPREVAENSDVVFLIVGYPTDVKSCILGEDGVLEGIKEGGIITDMTTSDPALAVEMAKICKETKNVSLIDAPVSGGDLGAKNAALTIMVGGEDSAVGSVEPLLKTMGKTIEHMGGPGCGQHTKMANQIMIGTTMIGLMEGMLYAKEAGLDVNQVIQAVRGGAAGSKSLELYAERILKEDFEPGFFVDHFVKDLGICMSESERMGLDFPGLALANKMYEETQKDGFGLKGTQALMLTMAKSLKRDA